MWGPCGVQTPAQHGTSSDKEEGETIRCFSNRNRSLLRQQPGAGTSNAQAVTGYASYQDNVTSFGW